MRLPRSTRTGSILLLALVLSMGVLLTMVALVSSAHSLGASLARDLDRTAALSLVEGITEIAQKQMLDDLARFRVPAASGTADLGGQTYAYTATPTGDSFPRTDADGVTSTVQHWVVSATVTSGDSGATIERVVDLTMTPLFQFVIFYRDDLELLPGPSMSLSGRVHANGDIYVGCGNTLTVDSDYFQCTGSILRRRKNDGSESTGTVRIKVKDESSFAELGIADDAESTDWAVHALDTWKEGVQDGAHGVRALEAPRIESVAAFNADGSKGYYHEHAGLVVVDDRAYDGLGNPVDLGGALRQRSMFDAREGKTVTVTEIDIGALNGTGHFPANGLVYAYRNDASQSQPNGIRLVGGAELGAPLTVVSEDPVYIRGNFNTVNKKGAAVIADAVNLLSNNWSDSGGTMQTASATTYNFAMVSGIVPTPDGGGAYSGGFENLPRFHENWNGVRATIRGAFINLFDSRIGRAPWRTTGVYRPPIRDWNYDADFNNLENLPPFTPQVARFDRLLWSDRTPLPF